MGNWIQDKLAFDSLFKNSLFGPLKLMEYLDWNEMD